MTIDDAIKHAEEVANANERLCETVNPAMQLSDYGKCAKEHKQLAEWLKELKRHREAWKKVKEEVKEMAWSLEAYVPDLDVREVDLDDVLNIIEEAQGEVGVADDNLQCHE